MRTPIRLAAKMDSYIHGITNQLLVLTLERRDWQATANRFRKFMLQSLPTMKARFIGEQISVEWDKPPFLEKKPTCPDRLIWSGENLQVALKLAEWRDYQRRGRMETNMRPEHRQRARQRGSWGVGRFYFRVLVTDGRTFELYYDRAAKGSDQRKGSWFLSQELL